MRTHRDNVELKYTLGMSRARTISTTRNALALGGAGAGGLGATLVVAVASIVSSSPSSALARGCKRVARNP
jgi:L-cysteine desulfidase